MINGRKIYNKLETQEIILLNYNKKLKNIIIDKPFIFILDNYKSVKNVKFQLS